MTAPTIVLDDRARVQRFEDMVRTHRAKAVRITYSRFGDWEDAEEAVQEATLKMWRQLESLDKVVDLGGWLVAEAKWQVLRIAENRRKAVPALLGEHVERVESQQLEPSSLPCTGESETMERVQVALAAMSPAQRQVVEMHCLQLMPVAEVAEKLGITRRAVTHHLRDAMTKVDLSGAPWKSYHAELGVDAMEARMFAERPDLLKMLGPRHQEAVRLRYIERLARPEVAKRMGIGSQAVANYTRDARRMIRQLIADLSPVASPA